MIVWIASFSRSGNTFFRIMLKEIYGVPTYAAFFAGEPLLLNDAGDLVNYRALPETLQAAIASGDDSRIRSALDELDRAKEVYFIKTHAGADELYGTAFRAILLVRDGRDALLSFANYFVDIHYGDKAFQIALNPMRRTGLWWRSKYLLRFFARYYYNTFMRRTGLKHKVVSHNLDRLIEREHSTYLNWSVMNRSWLDHNPAPVVLKYESLVTDPIKTVIEAVQALELSLEASACEVPEFADLKRRFPSFFRRGVPGDWAQHFSSQQLQSFRLRHGEVMTRLGYSLTSI